MIQIKLYRINDHNTKANKTVRYIHPISVSHSCVDLIERFHMFIHTYTQQTCKHTYQHNIHMKIERKKLIKVERQYHIVLVRLSIALTKHFLKNQLVDRRIYCILTACSPSLKEVRAGAQSMNSSNGHRETLLTACSAGFFQEHQTRGGTTHSWLGFSHINHQQSSVHSPKRSLACVNLTYN